MRPTSQHHLQVGSHPAVPPRPARKAPASVAAAAASHRQCGLSPSAAPFMPSSPDAGLRNDSRTGSKRHSVAGRRSLDLPPSSPSAALRRCGLSPVQHHSSHHHLISAASLATSRRAASHKASPAARAAAGHAAHRRQAAVRQLRRLRRAMASLQAMRRGEAAAARARC